MVTDEKQYEIVAKRVVDFVNGAQSGLKIFLPSYSAILGGSIELRLQMKGAVPTEYQYLSDGLVSLLTLVCVTIVWQNLRAWFGYRDLLTRLTADSPHPAPPPAWFGRSIIEIVMCAAMFAACIAFWRFNPFGLPNPN